MNFPEALLQLSDNAKKLLCYFAYTGDEIDSAIRNQYARNLGLTVTQGMTAESSLRDFGFITEERRYYYGNVFYINTNYICYVLFYLHMEHPEWINMLTKSTNRSARQHVCRTLDNVVSCVVRWNKLKKEGKKLEPLSVPQTVRTYREQELYREALSAVLFEPEMEPLLCALNPLILGEIIEQTSTRALENDHSRVIDLVRRLRATRPDFTRFYNHSLGLVCMNEFYASGNWYFDEFQVAQDDYYRIWVDAVRLAYKGEYTPALKMMNAAFRIRNTMVEPSDKNVFADYLSNYLMVLIYAHEGGDGSRKKLDMATRKNLIGFNVNAAAHTLAYYFRNMEQEIQSGILARALYSGNHTEDKHGPWQLVCHVTHYLGLKPSELKYAAKTPDINIDLYIPTIAILRHEMSKYLPMDADEKEHLEQVFGGKPLLTSIHRKEAWELVLEDIYNKETVGNVQDAGDVTARGIYVMNAYNENVDVREQNRLKSGAWGKGKRLSVQSYADGRFQMDDIDHKIYEANRSKGRSAIMPNVTVAIPWLVGTEDRLYLDDSSHDLEPITVVQEKPFLVLEKDKAGIHLHTNIPGKVNYSRSVIWNLDEKMMRLTYYPMDKKERTYFSQLTSLGTLPLEAEPMLQQVFPTLKGKVEIHTDFIEGVEQLQEVEGQTKVCLRVIPRNACFDVSMYVVPLENGHQSFVPGEGKDIVYDDREGERFQVKRHKRQEKRNAQVFTDFIEEELDAYGDDGDNRSRGTIELNGEELIALMDFAHEHPENGYIEWPEGEKLRLKIAQPSSWSVSMKSHNGWFDLEGDVQVDDDTVLSISQLLDIVANSLSRYIQLNDSEYLAITDSLRKQLMKLSSVASVARGKTRIPAVGVALMGSAFDGDLEIKHTKAVDDLRKKIKDSSSLRPVVPDELNATLRDYQFDGYQWMSRLDSWGAGACLADDMGLGKTIQAISFILSKRNDGASLVVAPASVVPNWRNEIKRFAPTLNIVILNEQSDRQKAIEDADNGTVLITTYGLLITQEEALTAKEWGTICLDEAHTIKNRDTKMSGVCMKLLSRHRIILTGTPLQNHLGELWNLFQFVNPGLLGSYEQFQKKFIMPIEAGGDEERRQMLRRMIKPFMLRRTKQEVASELPDKEEITLHVELSTEEMGVYEVIRRRAKDELEELQQSGKKVNMNALAEITKLRQASCSAQLAEKSWSGPCSKLDTFVDLVTELKQGGHRALVFSQFTSFLDMAKKALDNCKELKGLRYFYLDGATPMKKREQMVKAFQKGECDLFIISLKAGGLGLNLTGANYVIHLDPWWNPAIEQQATDRAHRIGQTEKVTVYHLISSNTIEEKILRLHEHKRDLATSLLEGTNMSHKITTEELLDMIAK